MQINVIEFVQIKDISILEELFRSRDIFMKINRLINFN